MAMDATFQIRMNSELKSEVESLYRSLGKAHSNESVDEKDDRNIAMVRKILINYPPYGMGMPEPL